MNHLEIITAICLGLGLSAACGFRIFVPLLVASVASYFQWIPTTEGLSWLATLPAIIAFGVASLIEIGAYYIPVVDHALDLIATPLSMVAGALLATSFFPINDPLLKYGLGIIVGAGSAGVVQAGTVFTRLFSGKTTLATANPVVSTSENIAAFGTSLFAVFLPVFTAFLMVLLVAFLFRKLFFRKSSR